MDTYVHARAFRFRSFLRSFFNASEPRRRVVTLNQRRASRSRGSREETGGRENIAGVTTPRAPANIFSTKIESGSITVYVIGSEGSEETSERIEAPERDRSGWATDETRGKEGERARDRKAAFPTNCT